MELAPETLSRRPSPLGLSLKSQKIHQSKNYERGATQASASESVSASTEEGASECWRPCVPRA
ncbi:hypothetical protein B0H12DRAFT_1143261 [Mycena haematopus]|nr:hypothetical protein B0H12DRAFT_1143261 [Mycena haematopus]